MKESEDQEIETIGPERRDSNENKKLEDEDLSKSKRGRFEQFKMFCGADNTSISCKSKGFSANQEGYFFLHCVIQESNLVCYYVQMEQYF